MKAHQRHVADWLARIGATVIRIEPGGKHPRLCFRYSGQNYTTIISGSDADIFVPRQKIRDLKRLLGLTNTAQSERGERQKRRRRVPQDRGRDFAQPSRFQPSRYVPFQPFAGLADMLAGRRS
jgi:hypothetical protein